MTIRPEDELLSLEYVAACLDCSKRAVERLIAAKKIPAVIMSRKATKIRRSALQSYIAARETVCDNSAEI